MKKTTSFILTLCMLIGMFGETFFFGASAKSDTPQEESAELFESTDASVGENGAADAPLNAVDAPKSVGETDFTELRDMIDAVILYGGERRYTRDIKKARNVLNRATANQETVDTQVAKMREILQNLVISKKVEFDDDNIAISFGAVSDIHILERDDQSIYEDSASIKYRKALQLLKKHSGGKLDAITIGGDIAGNKFSTRVTDGLKQINSDELSPETKVFFVSGNHEAEGDNYEQLHTFYNELSQYLDIDLPSSDIPRGDRHAVIKGYHFLAINMMKYDEPGGSKFYQEDLDWLTRELAAARAAAPGQPIFVYMHAGIYGTTYGSNLYTGHFWASKEVADYLKDYPEVIAFTGHVHFPIADDRTIYQDDFTVLNCGSTKYMILDFEYLETGKKFTCKDSSKVSSGMLVQVDKNNNIKITRIDFSNDKVIKKPFVLPAPDLKYKTNLCYYNNDVRTKHNKAPVFPANSKVSAEATHSNITVTYAAANDDDMVHHYEIKVNCNSNGKSKEVKTFSGVYLYSNPEDFPQKYTRTFDLDFDLVNNPDYDVEVCAVDSFGGKSKPIVYNSLVGNVEIPSTSGGDKLNIDFIKRVARNTADGDVTVREKGGYVSSWKGKSYYNGTGNGFIEVSVPSSVHAAEKQKFTASVTFVPENTIEKQTIFGCMKADSGYAFEVNPDGTLGFTMNTERGPVSVTSANPLVKGELYVATAVYYAAFSSLKLYLNGAEEDSNAHTAKISADTTAPFIIGAHMVGENACDSFFRGKVFGAEVYGDSLTAEQVSAKNDVIKSGTRYKNMQPLYDELGYVNAVKKLNNGANKNVDMACDNTANMLKAVLSALPIDAEIKNAAINRAAFDKKINGLGGSVAVPATDAPVISGVKDGETYNLSEVKSLKPTWDNATSAELNFTSVSSGTEITKPGEYQLLIRNGDKSTVAEFTVVAAAPVVEGVQEGGKYDVYLGKAPVITFDVGEATLNGEPFVSGTKVEAVGDYTLVVDNDGSVVTINFSVIDTKPEYVLGDPDADGEVTILDALMVLRASVGYARLTGDELLAADVDNDDKITTADALGILRVSSGLSKGF